MKLRNFIPAAGYINGIEFVANNTNGYYWTSSLNNASSPDHAKELSIVENEVIDLSSERCFGHPVRAVCVPQY